MPTRIYRHICGQCRKGFNTQNEYLVHKCKSGFTPKSPENLGPEFASISESALKRGAERKKK